ncbi:MAG: hypothetical protein JW862_02685 [Anaerolineales bacterium]|nr:hypothetical protein [Anaerolineales bacterium]
MTQAPLAPLPPKPRLPDSNDLSPLARIAIILIERGRKAREENANRCQATHEHGTTDSGKSGARHNAKRRTYGLYSQ